MTTSAVLHTVAMAAILYLARSAVTADLPRASRPLTTFVSLLPAPDPARVVPLEPMHLPPAIKEEPKPAEPVPPKMEAPPVPEPRALAPRVPTPPAPEPRREKPVAVEPPRPAPPVTVGTFASSPPAAHAYEPVRSVQRAGFDAPAAAAPEVKTGRATVGAFDQPTTAARPQPGSDRPNVVADAGFGTTMAPAGSQPAPRVVADAGFGGPSEPAGSRTPRQEIVRATEFDAKPAPPPTPAARPSARVEIPLEILSKPTPAYTNEARTLKIEGDVVLDVNFAATGEIRVLSVVRGLGHGLDESATRAARGMRFKPAQSAGHPIDFRTTVHIVFRLA